jgi:hypothetical protein
MSMRKMTLGRYLATGRQNEGNTRLTVPKTARSINRAPNEVQYVILDDNSGATDRRGKSIQ